MSTTVTGACASSQSRKVSASICLDIITSGPANRARPRAVLFPLEDQGAIRPLHLIGHGYSRLRTSTASGGLDIEATPSSTRFGTACASVGNVSDIRSAVTSPEANVSTAITHIATGTPN